MLGLFLGLCFALPSLVFPVSPIGAAESKTIRIIGTSDIHGQTQNWDYFSDTAITRYRRGMAKICTYVNQVRASNPNTIVIDNGDTIQGTPLNYLFNVLTTTVTNPMAVAMNAISYTSMTLGNHEFNFGMAVLNKFISEVNFPVLAANVRRTTDQSLVFTPYLLQEVDGVQVGILGLTNTSVPHWERPENINGFVFTNPVQEAQTFVPEMRAAGADIIVIAAHSGTDFTYGYGHEENFILDLANQVAGVDVILAGHAHKLENTSVNGALIVEPRNAAQEVCDVTINLSGSGADWTVSSKSASVSSMDALVEDAGFLTLLKPYHYGTVAYVNTPVGEALGAFPGGFPARVQDAPTADLINRVQTEAAQEAGFAVDASLAALFTDSACLAAGPVKLKDIYGLYIYDNTLYVVEATGQIVKNALEQSAKYFNLYDYSPSGPTKNPAVRDYNYDMWSGISYRIDITKPAGQRIIDLKLQGIPLSMDQTLLVALNNYRATGDWFKGCKTLYSSTTEVRDLIVDWIKDHSPLDPNAIFEKNWSLYPDLFLRPNDLIDRGTFLDLVENVFGQPSQDTYLFSDTRRSTAIIVDASQGTFQFFQGEHPYGVRPTGPINARDGLLKFGYKANDLYLNASLSLRGGPSIATAIDRRSGRSYVLLSRDTASAFNAERALTYLINQGMAGIATPVTDWNVLEAYSDGSAISPWATSAFTYGHEIGLFFAQSLLNPQASLTNATALTWMRETRCPPITFLCTNDFHGQLEPSSVKDSSGVYQPAGGAAFDITYISQYKAYNPVGTFLVDEGDSMQGTPISNLLRGSSVIDVFNYMEYTASVFGNHEFDWGQEILEERVNQANFPRLSCNILLEGTDERPPWIQPYVIVKAKEVTIGLIGATTLETPSIVMPGNLAGLEFRDAAPIINSLAAELRAKGVDMIVVLAHMGGAQDGSGIITGEVAELARRLVGVDFIASGHSHTKLTGYVNNIPIIQQYSSGTALGIANLNYDRRFGGLYFSNLNVVTTWNAGIIPDPTIDAIVQKYKAQIAPLVNRAIGTINAPIIRTQNAAGESALGNLIADAQRWCTNAQVAFMNPGGIRKDLPNVSSPVYPHDVTWGEVYAVQPFDNELITMDLTGTQIATLLEQQWPPTQTATRTLQISGLRYAYKPANPPGSRILSLSLSDGTPIDPGLTYRVVCNIFLAGGGDLFAVFRQGTNVYHTGISDLNGLVDYIQSHWGNPPNNTPFTAEIEGRIQIVP